MDQVRQTIARHLDQSASRMPIVISNNPLPATGR